MKLAYFVIPHIGGTYTVFTALRAALAPYGVDVSWFGLCEDNPDVRHDVQRHTDSGMMMYLPPQTTEKERAKLVVEEIRKQGYAGIFVNILGDRFQTNISRYLPPDILRIAIVHNITPGTYAAAKAIRDYSHVTIGVSERIRQDLVEHHGFPRDRTFAVPSAIDTDAFRIAAERRKSAPAELRTLFVGRIEDASKGVLWLREILDALPDTIRLTVVGDGPDLAKLKRRLANHASRVHFSGAVDPSRISTFIAEHDVLIMPSRFEGLGMTMIEAMAGGCVPVVSHIRGVTDTVVDDGRNGILFPVGNYTAAAQAIARLDDNRDLLARMSDAARETVPGRFGIETMGARYNAIITSALIDGPQHLPTLDVDAWSIPNGLRAGLRTVIPLPLKNYLRVVRERLKRPNVLPHVF
ncbi:glycosyltransferase family 4 protein [Rhizobium sp. Leaf341]|uniref:glycosyltransferase family 4 protein n=1 Tax=Rhizobium sp. Leaf341 TaxID=1736344 RepID=UPI0007150754|nr:glycosyltransferase family 4 protein [Rhizobium sp. Leaf341]KQR76051.1 glycosyl transferase [Rhizobium sp. Leaf341]